jgi:hypothetical protein
MFTPALPNLPTGAGLAQTGVLAGQPGMAKAPALNQLVIDWPDERPGFPITSGRAMKLLLGPKLFVLDGSKPE